MTQFCDICGEKLGFRNRFRCQDGAVCKNCYQVVSGDFSRTIVKSTLSELKETYVKNAASCVSKREIVEKLKQSKSN